MFPHRIYIVFEVGFWVSFLPVLGLIARILFCQRRNCAVFFCANLLDQHAEPTDFITSPRIFTQYHHTAKANMLQYISRLSARNPFNFVQPRNLLQSTAGWLPRPRHPVTNYASEAGLAAWGIPRTAQAEVQRLTRARIKGTGFQWTILSLELQLPLWNIKCADFFCVCHKLNRITIIEFVLVKNVQFG